MRLNTGKQREAANEAERPALVKRIEEKNSVKKSLCGKPACPRDWDGVINHGAMISVDVKLDRSTLLRKKKRPTRGRPQDR